MKKVLIFIENDFISDSCDLLFAVKEIYRGEENETYAVIFNSNKINEIIKCGYFNYLIKICDKRIADYDTVNISCCMEELHKKYAFDCILICAKHFGRMLSPRLAMKLKAGLCADVIGIEKIEGETLFVRPAFDGKTYACVLCNGKPLMASVHTGAFTGDGEKLNCVNKTVEIEHKPENVKTSGIERISVNKKEENQDIRESEVLVSVGGGAKNALGDAKSLARELNAALSSSRKLVDEGLVSRGMQVGQSGKIVSPKLYLGLGIHGASQHVVGLKNIPFIIAVNKDKNAPLCSLADIVVECDAGDFAKKLSEKIKKLRK
jgi:electron transfer flavoprotein alpha subunit